MTISPVHVVFRVDAGTEIGTGHVMRCLTLANALKDHGGECVFVCRPHSGNLIEFIKMQGFTTIALPSLLSSGGKTRTDTPPHAAWLCTDQDTDARDTSAVLDEYFNGKTVDWLVVDHYALDARWEACLRPTTNHVLVIDDLADRPHDCDLLLDQSLGRDAADYTALVPQAAKLLIGPRYALLRPEFARLRAASLVRRENPQLRNLLVTMGGVDKNNGTEKVLDALATCPLPDGIKITVVMGEQAPWVEQVRMKAAMMPFTTDVQVGVRDMAALMVDSDLAIGAAGTTTWERCCVGLPSLIIETAKNQAGISRAMVAAGAGLATGDVQKSEFARTVIGAFTNAVDHNGLLKLSKRSAAICDGDGLARVVNLLFPVPVLFRDAVPIDSQRVWEWRQSINSAFQVSGGKTSFLTHNTWFEAAIKDVDRVFRIMTLGDLPCGYLRLDRTQTTRARVSVCLSPEMRGKRLGVDLLAEAVAVGKTIGLDRLDAEIHSKNTASHRLFTKAGYERIGCDKEFVLYRRKLKALS